MQDQTLYALDRECKTRTLSIDCTEALFKLALAEKQYAEVGTRSAAEPPVSKYSTLVLIRA